MKQIDLSALQAAKSDNLVEGAEVQSSDSLGSLPPDPLDKIQQKHTWDIDTTDGQRILLIGDSMNEYFRIRMLDYCRENGHDLRCIIWYGAGTKQFGSSDTIAHFIRSYKPSYIILNFGANELFVKDIRTKRQKFVEHILAQIGNIPFVWVGPPNWKEDTGINDLIRDNVGDSRYYESRRLTFNRYEDNVHPTRQSAADWADSVALFLANDAKVPLKMDVPSQALKKIPTTTILAIEKNHATDTPRDTTL